MPFNLINFKKETHSPQQITEHPLSSTHAAQLVLPRMGQTAPRPQNLQSEWDCNQIITIQLVM
jgi:hypothetical protein